MNEPIVKFRLKTIIRRYQCTTSTVGVSMEQSAVDGPSQSIRKANDNEHPLQESFQLSADQRERLVYKMNNNMNRGIVIIFNHRKFEVPGKYLEERINTDRDCRSLRECFRNLGFQLRIYNDKTCLEIKKILLEASQHDHSDNDCFVVIVLSHGEMGVVYAKDDHYEQETLWTNFTAVKCSSLVGKPKLFFIQACRGTKLDPGFIMNSSCTSKNSESMLGNKVFLDPNYNDDVDPNKKKSGYQQVHEADFLIAFATVPEYFSWRNTTTGSWFMQILCQELNVKSSSHHLLEILTFVCCKVAIERESHTLPKCPEKHKMKQSPCIESTLTKLLYF